MNVFFLAAGFGTRLRPITDNLPKPCVPFLNAPMGYYPFRFLENLKISSCVANSFYLPAQIEQLYKNPPYYKNKISISAESELILGSAGGLKKAAKYFSQDETILMMNADEIFFTKNMAFLQSAYQQHLASNNLATLIVTKNPEAGIKFGAIWCDQNHRVKTIMAAKSKPVEELTPWHYIGIIFLNKKVLSLIPDNLESNIFYDVLIKELGQSSVEAYPIECTWYETGNPADYLTATKNVLTHLDEQTIDFINQYDPSNLIKNQDGMSLISDAVSVNEKNLRGYNVISKSADQQLLNSLKLIENSVIIEKEILNLSYFS